MSKIFTATLHGEGPTKSTVRGKIPTGLVRLLGGDIGDVIEFEVTGKIITGGRLLKGDTKKADEAKANAYSQSRGNDIPKRQTSAPVKKLKKPTVEKAGKIKDRPKRPIKKLKKPVASVAKTVAKKVVKKPAKPQKPVVKKPTKAQHTAISKPSRPVKAKPTQKKAQAKSVKSNKRKTSVTFERPSLPKKSGSAKPKRPAKR